MFIHVAGELQSSRNIDMIVSMTGSKTKGRSGHLLCVVVTDVLVGIVFHRSESCSTGRECLSTNTKLLDRANLSGVICSCRGMVGV